MPEGSDSRIAETGQEISGFLLLRIAEDILGSAFFADDAFIHVNHAVADVPGL